ncbi:hypothetical protein JCM16138_04320 [Thermococcus atlanticus]
MIVRRILLTIIIMLLVFSMVLQFNAASKTINVVVIMVKAAENSTVEELRSAMAILADRIHAVSPQSRVREEIHGGRITLIVEDMEDNKTALLNEVVTKRGGVYVEFQGRVIATNSDVVNVSNPMIENLNGKWMWRIPFRISDDAAWGFGNAVKGKAGYPVDIFVDPPENCLIIMAPELYRMISSSTFNAMAPGSISLLERIRLAFNVIAVPYFPENESRIKELAEKSKKAVLIGITGRLGEELRMKGITVVSFNEPNENPSHLIRRALGLFGPYLPKASPFRVGMQYS